MRTARFSGPECSCASTPRSSGSRLESGARLAKDSSLRLPLRGPPPASRLTEGWQRRSFAVVSPGMSGQTMAGRRAPMLGKWPNPNKLSGKVAPAGGLWIRRVLVRAQEGQLESAGALTLVSNPADFRFVCCGSVPTREAECPQHTRSLVANLPFRFSLTHLRRPSVRRWHLRHGCPQGGAQASRSTGERSWVGTDQVRGERAPGEAIVRKAGVLAGPWLARGGR
jgi:hypothetical protein